MGRAEDIFDTLITRGTAAIDDFIVTAVSEELFLDFKRSADNGAGAQLHQDDRKNLAKAISGFGNSEGGVIVWGVDCSRDPRRGDVAATRLPLTQPARFKSLLEGAVSGATVPAHGGVRHHAIVIDSLDTGFVATLVPSSNHAPHQTVWGGIQYYMRAGSSFAPVPHAVLAGMFGRRPQPVLMHSFESGSAGTQATEHGTAIAVPVRMVIRNNGRGIAESVFVNALVSSMPGPSCQVRYLNNSSELWPSQATQGGEFCTIASSHLKLAPGAWAVPVELLVQLTPPVNAPLRIEGSYGCAGGEISEFFFSVTPDALHLMFTSYGMQMAQGQGAQAALRELSGAFRTAMVFEPDRITQVNALPGNVPPEGQKESG